MASDRAQYVHRIGRTARAGKGGRGLLILADFERYFIQMLKVCCFQIWLFFSSNVKQINILCVVLVDRDCRWNQRKTCFATTNRSLPVYKRKSTLLWIKSRHKPKTVAIKRGLAFTTRSAVWNGVNRSWWAGRTSGPKLCDVVNSRRCSRKPSVKWDCAARLAWMWNDFSAHLKIKNKNLFFFKKNGFVFHFFELFDSIMLYTSM